MCPPSRYSTVPRKNRESGKGKLGDGANSIWGVAKAIGVLSFSNQRGLPGASDPASRRPFLRFDLAKQPHSECGAENPVLVRFHSQWPR